jgi:sulfur-oxidizing protein SoxY
MSMALTRREALAATAGAIATLGFGISAARASVDEAVAAFTGGVAVEEGGVTLTAPEIAENGNTVPIEVSAEGADEITVLAAGNPQPGVVTFKFGPLSGARRASTRIRLSTTQDVVAVAKMADGSFRQASALVKVTIGGCGG